MNHTTVANAKATTWRQTLVNVQKVLRAFDTDLFGQLDDAQWQGAATGAGMIRVNHDSRVINNTIDPVPATAKQQAECRRWLAACRVPVEKRIHTQPWLQDLDTHIEVQSNEVTRALELFDSLVMRAEVGNDYSDQLLITCEDKDPSRLWAMPAAQGTTQWLSMLVHSGRWELLRTTEQAVLAYTRRIMNNCLPRTMRDKCTDFGRRRATLRLLQRQANMFSRLWQACSTHMRGRHTLMLS
jgi:hypothetical protein